ncbi:hypothetical protein HKD37_01G000456 [Glycine soja]
MKADMEAMKEHMTTMMDEMMSMRKMMEDNTAIVVAASTATKMDPIHPAGFNQVNRPVSDVVGQGGETVKNACGPHHVQVQRKHSFPPYRLPPNYTSPIIVYASDLVFAGKRIEVGLRKGKFNYVASTNPGNVGLGRSGERKKEGETHVVAAVLAGPNFPLAPYNPMYQYPPQQYHYSANVSPSHYLPPY